MTKIMSSIDSTYQDQVERVLSNPGLRTNLFFNAVSGTVDFTPACIAINSATCREYYFGNYLVLYRQPADKDFEALQSLFAAQVAHDARVEHSVFVWSADQTAPLEIARFLASGYSYVTETALLAKPEDLSAPAPLDSRFSIRKYAGGGDWEQWYALQMEGKEVVQDNEKYHAYLRHLQATYLTLIEQDRGAWWGAFHGDEQIGNLGLFFDGDTGRFQSVYTKEKYRNRGICRALLAAAASDAWGRASRLIIVADDDYYALALYEKMGFKVAHKLASLCKA